MLLVQDGVEELEGCFLFVATSWDLARRSSVLVKGAWEVEVNHHQE
jgi:hypothetical protein